tara:strand:+ start:407 stop:979 length:573 start_codon:yes stop_codon:yes gene_type:complete
MKSKLELLKDKNTILLIIDVQEKLIPVINNKERLIFNIQKLIKASNILGLDIIYSEQNPERLGTTLTSIKEKENNNVFSKMAFSCCNCKNLMNFIKSEGKKNVLICGVETHVCVQQTCIDLIREGYIPHIVIDAISSRKLVDHEISIRKLELSGTILTTTETAIFELCQTAERIEFKPISKLIKESEKNS